MASMFELEFKETAIKDLDFWKKNNPKILKKIGELFKSMQQDPYKGIGKPEELKYDLSGYWSRRINIENRIVYKVEGKIITIHSLRFHYERKLN